MNEISDDNNFGNAILIRGLVDPTPNGKKFSFRTRDMNSMVNSLDIVATTYYKDK